MADVEAEAILGFDVDQGSATPAVALAAESLHGVSAEQAGTPVVTLDLAGSQGIAAEQTDEAAFRLSLAGSHGIAAAQAGSPAFTLDLAVSIAMEVDQSTTLGSVWDEGIALHASSLLASGGKDTDYINLDAIAGEYAFVTFEFVNASEYNNRVIVGFAPSTDAGAHFDTVPPDDAVFAINVDRGQTVRKTFRLNYPYAEVRVHNYGAGALTYESWYAIRRYSAT